MSRAYILVRFRFWRLMHKLSERVLPRWHHLGWQNDLHSWIAWKRIGAWVAWEDEFHPERVRAREERLRVPRES